MNPYVLLYKKGFGKLCHSCHKTSVRVCIKVAMPVHGKQWFPHAFCKKGHWLMLISLIPQRKPYIHHPGIPFQTFPWSHIPHSKQPYHLALISFHMRPQSPYMSLLGALQGLPYACSRSARKTARKRCLWKPAYLLMPNMGRRIASIFPWMPTGGAPAFTAWHIRYRAGFQWFW